MKIALELQPCCGQPSGVGLYTYELAKHLHNDDMVSFQGNVFNFAGRNDNSQSLNGVTIPIVENRTIPYGVYRRVWRYLPVPYTSFFPSANISHFFNYIVPPHITGKVITTIYDVTYLRFPETMDKRNLQRITKDIAYSIERSEKILTISEFSKQELIDAAHVPADKIVIVPPAASLSKELAEESVLADKFGLTEPYLLHIGNLEPRKNLKTLIKAFEQLKQEQNIPHKLVLVGGKGWSAEEMLTAIQNSPYTDDIMMTGYVSAAEKNRFYKNAAALVFPSVYEGFGMPPLEAMIWGTPVVCSSAASIPEVVGDAAMLFSPQNSVQLAQAIDTVLTNKSLVRELVEKGTRRTELFTWEKSAKKLQEIYKKEIERL